VCGGGGGGIESDDCASEDEMEGVEPTIKAEVKAPSAAEWSRITELPKFAAPPMADGFCHMLTEQAVMRMLANRESIGVGGAAHIRVGMLVR